MAEYRYSSTTGLNRCISSIKSTSLGSKLVSTPAKSPGLSSTGPEVTLKPTPSSLAMILLKVVLPKPGGPCKRTWSNASARRRAALTKMRRLSTTLSCPLKSSKFSGRKAFSKSRSLVVSCCSRISKFSSIFLFMTQRYKRYYYYRKKDGGIHFQSLYGPSFQHYYCINYYSLWELH